MKARLVEFLFLVQAIGFYNQYISECMGEMDIISYSEGRLLSLEYSGPQVSWNSFLKNITRMGVERRLSIQHHCKLRLRSQSQIVRIHEKLWECLHTPVTLALGGKNRRINGADWLTRLVEVLSDKFSEGPCFNKQNNEEMIEEGIPIMV